MVREIKGFFIDVESQEPRRIEVPDPDFCHQPVNETDLVDAFIRFVSEKSGSFERLLNNWIAGRLRAGMPVNLTDPDCASVPPRLKKALQAGFDQVRSSRRKAK